MAKKERIVSYTSEELRAKRARGEDKTDWARVAATTYEEVEAQIAADPDERDLVWDWSEVYLRPPRPKTVVNMRVDTDILEFFKQDGRGYQTRINAVLRGYVLKQKLKPVKRARKAAAE
ncbi:MAG TPA: hypothetical protein DCL48_10845 [Alphaproteobacteria bacterium]|nr:hypothetical protein [Alphaproteobacteria bacterium]